MAIRWYAATGINGGDDNALDKVPNPGDYTDLQTGDKCFVMTNDLYTRIYEYDEDLTDAEDFFGTIQIPDGNVSGSGAWKEKRTTGLMTFWAGTVANHINATISEDGGVVSLDFICTGDIPGIGIWSDDLNEIPIQSVTLNHGSDTSPTANYVYILPDARDTLIVGSSWPATEHVKISYCLVPSAAHVASDGAYILQNWNDGNETSGMGHLSSMGENIRLTQNGAHYHSGCAGNGLTDGYITIVTDDTPDSAYFLSTAGVCFQMHRHTVPAYNSQTQAIHIVNAYGTPYKSINDIRDETVDAANNSLTNKYYNVVFWQVANKGGEYAPVMMNMPTGVYVQLANAITDVDGYDVYDIPHEFKEDSATGFLLCRITFRQTATGITVHNTTDLRGRTPGTASGTSIGGDHEFADNQFKLFNVLASDKIVDFDLSGLTSPSTRTITPADADMTLLSATDHTDLTDGGESTLHYHNSLKDGGQVGAVYANGAALDLHYNGNQVVYTSSIGLMTSLATFSLVGNLGGGMEITNDGVTSLFHVGSKKLVTSAAGATVTGTLVADGLTLGDSDPIIFGAGPDAMIFSDGTILKIVNGANTETMANFTPNGAVELYFNNVKTLELKSGGIIGYDEFIAQGALPGLLLKTAGEAVIGEIQHNATNLTLKNYVDSGWVTIEGDDTNGDQSFLFKGDPDGPVELYHNGTKKLETSATGATLTGTLVADGLTLGDNENITLGAGPDGKIASDGTNIVIKNGVGNENMAAFTQDGAVTLYHNASPKLSTSAAGATLTGILVADGLTLGLTEPIVFNTEGRMRSDGTSVRIYKNDYTEVLASFTQDGACALYWGGVHRFNTTSTGAHVIGNLETDGLSMGDFPAVILLGAGGQIYSSGSNIVITNPARDENMAVFNPDSSVQLYHNGNLKFATSAAGATLTGVLTSDGLTLGDNKFIILGAGQDGALYSDGTNIILADGGSFKMAEFIVDGAVELYHNHLQKFQTSATGATLTGILVADGLTMGDSEKIIMGADTDFVIKFNGTHCQLNTNTQSAAIQLTYWNGGSTELMLSAVPDGAVNLFFNNEVAFYTSALGMYFQNNAANGTDIGSLTCWNSTVYLDNQETSGGVQLRGQNSASAVHVLFSGNPNGAASLFYNNDDVFKTTTHGHIFGSGSYAAQLTMDGWMKLQGVGTNVQMYLTAGNDAGSLTNLIIGNPNGAVDMYYDGSKVFSTRVDGVTILNTAATLNLDIIGDDAAGCKIVNQNTNDYIMLAGYIAAGPTRNAMFLAYPQSWAQLYYAGVGKLLTATNGVQCPGTRAITVNTVNGLVSITGQAGSGWATGFIFYGSSGTGRGGLYALGDSDDLTYYGIGKAYNDTGLRVYPDGAAQLYYNAALKVATSTTGATVTGVLEVTTSITLGSVKILTGTGSPESAVSAPVGSLWLRTDGAAGSIFYSKNTGGTGNTGWRRHVGTTL